MTPNDMTSQDPGPKIYTEAEMVGMWPSAAGELRGFANSLDGRGMGITAAQMRMAVQMADAYLKLLQQKTVMLVHEPQKDGE